MFDQALDILRELMDRGGVVMRPLGLLSVAALTLIFERCWFFVRMNHPGKLMRFRRVGRCLRQGQRDEAAQLVCNDNSVYGQMVRQLLDEGASDAAIADAIETQRPRLDRFMPTLGTIITAAPMLGILGTVVGIIRAFRVLSEADTMTDPSKVGGGIAEALLTTVVGLVIALVVLFPYNAFRAQIERTLGRMESLAAGVAKEKD